MLTRGSPFALAIGANGWASLPIKKPIGETFGAREASSDLQTMDSARCGAVIASILSGKRIQAVESPEPGMTFGTLGCSEHCVSVILI